MLLYACANVVAPTGGPRDEDPPEVIRSVPQNRTTNFNDDQIRIFFNEFVELHNIRQQLLVSPPMEQLPEVRIRGRSIVIEIEEELRDNSTYNFFFGDAIRDITEGNTIPNFQFVLSTGDYVDSLLVSGQVKNAFNLAPEEGVYVMLYSNVYDSVPYLERPVYLAKTDKDGQFTISNMAGGEYLMFALEDLNNNFLYDLPNERIGFLDSLVRPEYVPIPDEDPAEDDGEDIQEEGEDEGEDEEPFLPGFRDDQEADPPEETVPPTPELPTYTLYMFQEADTVQRVVSSSLTKTGLITIAFRVPFDSAHVREIRRPFDEKWHIPEFSANKDTLKLWFADTGRDSLFLQVFDGDCLLDTIKRATTPRRTRDSEDPETPPTLNITPDFRRPSAVPHHKPLSFTSEHPLATIEQDKIELLINDSIPIDVSFHFTDHVQRNVYMTPPLMEKTSYFIEILPGAFTDVFGLANDTLARRFTSTSPEDYGNLVLDMSLPDNDVPYILQLLDRNENIIREQIIGDGGQKEFRYLESGQYYVRLIKDLNNNKQWDPGNYLEQRQPEPVYMLPDTIRIRENWDVEFPWNITPVQ